jgi:hypothetical protein
VITEATIPEPLAAAPLLDRRRQAREGMKTLGADKGYYDKAFVALLRSRNLAPHIARKVRRQQRTSRRQIRC